MHYVYWLIRFTLMLMFNKGVLLTCIEDLRKEGTIVIWCMHPHNYSISIIDIGPFSEHENKICHLWQIWLKLSEFSICKSHQNTKWSLFGHIGKSCAWNGHMSINFFPYHFLGLSFFPHICICFPTTLHLNMV